MLEVVVVNDGLGDIRPGDHVLIDWSRLPEKGAVAAMREHGNGVRFDVYKGDERSMIVGRLVNPSRLLKA